MIVPPVEEELIRILRYANINKIRDLLSTTNNNNINLYHLTEKLKTPLTTAIDRGDPRILSMLLENIPTNLNETTTFPSKCTILMYASFHARNTEILQILIEKGSSKEKTDIRGWNCLHHAIVGEKINNVNFLLDAGLEINALDSMGRTPLTISVFLSNLEITTTLLNHPGVNVDVKDEFGLTTLDIAILRKKRDANILLQKSTGEKR